MSEFFDSLNFSNDESSSSQRIPAQSQALVFWKKGSPSPSVQSAIGTGGTTHHLLSRQPPNLTSPLATIDARRLNRETAHFPTIAESVRNKSPTRASSKAEGKRRAVEHDEGDDGAGDVTVTKSIQSVADRRAAHRQRASKRTRTSRTSRSSVEAKQDDALSSTDSGRFIALMNASFRLGLNEDAAVEDPGLGVPMRQRCSSEAGKALSSSSLPPEDISDSSMEQIEAGGQDLAIRAVPQPRTGAWHRSQTDPHPRLGPSARATNVRAGANAHQARQPAKPVLVPQPRGPISRTSSIASSKSRSSCSPVKPSSSNSTSVSIPSARAASPAKSGSLNRSSSTGKKTFGCSPGRNINPLRPTIPLPKMVGTARTEGSSPMHAISIEEEEDDLVVIGDPANNFTEDDSFEFGEEDELIALSAQLAAEGM